MGPVKEFEKDPTAVKDYLFDWTKWMAVGDSILTATVSATGTGLTIASVTHATDTATAWVSGGVVGQRYRVTCSITTVQGRTDTKSCYITVVYQ